MAATVHDFVIVIPVADRPRHLADCLSSLLELCRHYPYEGDVVVLVADDSLDIDNRQRHETIARDFTQRGLKTHYLGQDEQRALVEALAPPLRARLAGMLGDGADYARKGASITRNIAYLWLNRLPAGDRKRLFWFLDSDQEFRVNVETAEGEDLPYAIDYLHGLDRIFSETSARILTGKVVGDPPVSPAVMAGNFIDDVLGFLTEMGMLDPRAACGFHGAARPADDAAYHDMADLFGFRRADAAFRYRCPLRGGHDHAACFAEFAARLNRFFDGEHPTRRSFYQPGDLIAGIQPARTIYTGNFVFTPGGLEWFVPFAALKLRMAGPTLGRLIKAELGDAFVSANLPMLHRRTQGETGRSECRPGVDREPEGVDLSGEFERQYYGDVMLFAVERLTEGGFPKTPTTREDVAATVDAIEAEMHARYRSRQVQTAEKIEHLAALLDAPELGGWLGAEALAARTAFRRFIADLRRNFALDSPAWRRLDSPVYRDERKCAIAAAIAAYPDDREAWRQALGARTR